MLITKEVSLTMNNRYVKFYREKGYDVKGCQTVIVKVEDLTKKSNVIIDVKCDKCGIVKKVQYNFYNDYTKNQTENYYCTKCVKSEKTKKTVNDKYGCDNVFQNDEIKEKCKITMLDNHGVDHPSKSKDILEKSRKTCLERFGTEYASQNEEIKQKIEDTFMRNYGVKTSLLDPTTIEKIKLTCLEKYGVDNVKKSPIIQEKIKNRMIELYGEQHALNVDKFKQKYKNTCFENFGVENSQQNKEVREKGKQTRIEKGSYLTDEQRSDFKNYWLKVKVITTKNKKKLFENWDGNDYYDGKYIKDNFILPSGSKEYPTIDHKTSVSFGYKNDISPEEIGKLENLCITTRSNNSRKHKNCEE